MLFWRFFVKLPEGEKKNLPADEAAMKNKHDAEKLQKLHQKVEGERLRLEDLKKQKDG